MVSCSCFRPLLRHRSLHRLPRRRSHLRCLPHPRWRRSRSASPSPPELATFGLWAFALGLLWGLLLGLGWVDLPSARADGLLTLTETAPEPLPSPGLRPEAEGAPEKIARGFNPGN